MSENQLSSIVKNMVKDQIPDAIKEKIGLDRESLKQKYGENLFNNLRIVGSNEEINWSYSSDDEKIFDYIGGSGYFNDKDEFIPNDVKMMITKEIVGQGGEEYVLHEFALGDENLLESLEICQKSLGKYPEEKRIFYLKILMIHIVHMKLKEALYMLMKVNCVQLKYQMCTVLKGKTINTF